MAIIDKLAFWKKEPEKKSSVIGVNDIWSQYLGLSNSTGATPQAALNLYDQSTAVSVPVNWISDAFVSIDPVLWDGEKFIRQHPVLDLLNKPSPFYDALLFRESLSKAYLITGETYLVAIGNIRRPPLQLNPVSPSNVTVTQTAGGIAGLMQVTGESWTGEYNGKQVGRDFRYFSGNLKELKQIRNYTTKNNSLLRGQSPLVSASQKARQDILGSEHNVSILEKGGRVSLVFHYKQDMNPDDYEATLKCLRDQFGGATEAGKIGMSVGEELEIKELSKSNRDMDFANLQGMAKSDIALQYKFPLALLTLDASTMNNLEVSIPLLYDNAVLPLADRIYDGLSAFLLPKYDLDPSLVKITYDPRDITALQSRFLDELNKRVEMNLETRNELRGILGREPVEDGGDTIYQNANLIPAGTDVFTSPTPIMRDPNAEPSSEGSEPETPTGSEAEDED
jgi:HK97 family phage portal protein